MIGLREFRLRFRRIGLCWLTAAFGVWAFGKRAGFYAGLCMATCIGLFLFTRILIPDVILTFTVALAMWALLRVLDERRAPSARLGLRSGRQSGNRTASEKFDRSAVPSRCRHHLSVLDRSAIFRQDLEAASSHQRDRNHPFDCCTLAHSCDLAESALFLHSTLRSVPGEYHGFLWFFFINEQLLRFLNLRYPRDYDTVPRLYFWLFHLIWLFPWSVYLPAVAKLSYKPSDRAGQARLLALCWIGFVLVFFTFSTTQEYYSMPCYPAFALLLGSAMATGGDWVRRGTRALSVIAGCAALAALTILFLVRGVPTPGDIFTALTTHPAAYKLSMGHMEDLTLESFAYLRLPLFVAALAFLIGAVRNSSSQGSSAPFLRLR